MVVPKDGTKNVALSDYIVDPAGRTVRLTTTDRIWASPATTLDAKSQGDHDLVLKSQKGYVGPGALTIEVTDGASLTDPAGQVVVLTIPVQVGPETPVLRCPDDPLTLIEGGATLNVDVTSVCHVWVANPATLSGLKYTATWHKPVVETSLTASCRDA